MKIILLGGTGFIGRHICEQLIRAGHEVTVATRKLENARAIQMLPRLQPLRCNVHDAQQLKQACAGHDVLINLVAILHGTEAEFEHVHVALPQSIVAACKATGISRIVHMSSLGAAPDAPSHYLRSKGRGEQVLAQSNLDVTILRPSVVFGEGDKLLNTFAQLQQSFPVMPLACAQAQFQPVWVEDVAQAVVNSTQPNHYQNDSNPRTFHAGELPQTLVKTYELAGPVTLSLRQLVSLAGQCVGAQRTIIALPNALARCQAFIMEKLPGPTLMSRDNLDSMHVPNVASGRLPGLQELGIDAANIYAIAPRYLQPASRLDAYRKQASR